MSSRRTGFFGEIPTYPKCTTHLTPSFFRFGNRIFPFTAQYPRMLLWISLLSIPRLGCIIEITQGKRVDAYVNDGLI
ncbi:hypothetical protein Y032_0019g3833 [Ancylostoma ceylanicum]|uniref:Uncharacterized protein n=1 Tax=Ancylostoma ceylanicum TaxID=53326 RepID=A0A016V2J2_9BILA|nr:hypothetical protein Y032_0019g3833 [Ancylostoma ceylanicum]